MKKDSYIRQDIIIKSDSFKTLNLAIQMSLKNTIPIYYREVGNTISFFWYNDNHIYLKDLPSFIKDSDSLFTFIKMWIESLDGNNLPSEYEEEDCQSKAFIFTQKDSMSYELFTIEVRKIYYGK